MIVLALFNTINIEQYSIHCCLKYFRNQSSSIMLLAIFNKHIQLFLLKPFCFVPYESGIAIILSQSLSVSLAESVGQVFLFFVFLFFNLSEIIRVLTSIQMYLCITMNISVDHGSSAKRFFAYFSSHRHSVLSLCPRDSSSFLGSPLRYFAELLFSFKQCFSLD